MGRIVLIGLGIGLAITAGIIFNPSDSNPVNSSPRKFVGRLVKIQDFSYPGSTIQAWQEVDGHLLILDQISQQWHLIDRNGKEIKRFGSAGPAPWQNQEVKNFRLQDDTLYSVDTKSMVVKSQLLGEHQGTYRKLQEIFWDGIHLLGSRFLLLNDESEAFGFFTFDLKTGVKGKLQPVAERHSVSSNQNIAFEGEFVQSDAYNFYICSRVGLFLVIDSLGNLIRRVSTIDKTSVPAIVERKAGNLVIFERQPDEIVNYSATADVNHLYILSQVAFQQSDQLRLDVYHVSGAYLRTFEVPNRGDNLPMKILKGDTSLYVIYEDQQIVVYDFEPVLEGNG